VALLFLESRMEDRPHLHRLLVVDPGIDVAFPQKKIHETVNRQRKKAFFRHEVIIANS
jgi:hypothetical protein